MIGGRLLARLLVAVTLGAVSVPVAHAASLALTEVQKAAAIRAGERSVTAENFDAEWRVSDGRGNAALVMTPFHRLLLAARHAAFDNRPLRPEEPDRILKHDANRLVIWVTLRGSSADFARHLVPTLLAGPHAIKAAFVQNEHTPGRHEDGSYLARCIYGFPTHDLTDTDKTVLAVDDADGRDVTRFSIDLARMR